MKEDIKYFGTYLRKSAISTDSQIKKILKNTSKDFLNELKKLAPIDKGDYKASWKLDENSASNSISVEFYNSMPYGFAIERGSTPGQRPWPSPGPRTILNNGKIYSKQAVGGTIDKVFSYKEILNLIEKIENEINKGFK